MLYFLKLKRQPLEVPSTYLWAHVDRRSDGQQPLAAAAAGSAAAVASAGAGGTDRGGISARLAIERRWSAGAHIFLIDTSASMSRQRRVAQPLGRVAAADRANCSTRCRAATPPYAHQLFRRGWLEVEQSFTDNVQELRRALKTAAVQPARRSPSLGEATPAGSGAEANPGKSEDSLNDQQVRPSRCAAKLYIFSDGRFPDVRGFLAKKSRAGVRADRRAGGGERGNRELYSPPQRPTPRPDAGLRAYLENHSDANRTATVELRFDGQLIDARDAEDCRRRDDPPRPFRSNRSTKECCTFRLSRPISSRPTMKRGRWSVPCGGRECCW